MGRSFKKIRQAKDGSFQFQILRCRNLDYARKVHVMELEHFGELALPVEFLTSAIASKNFRIQVVLTDFRYAIGYSISRIYENICVMRIAVTNEYRRCGVGSAMMQELAAEFEKKNMMIAVNERELAYQLFLRACGFICVEQQREALGNDDCYLFEKGNNCGMVLPLAP